MWKVWCCPQCTHEYISGACNAVQLPETLHVLLWNALLWAAQPQSHPYFTAHHQGYSVQKVSLPELLSHQYSRDIWATLLFHVWKEILILNYITFLKKYHAEKQRFTTSRSSFLKQCQKTAAVFFLRGSYTSAVGNLIPTLSAKLWPCSKVWWCPHEVDLGQYGAILLIQGNEPKGKIMHFWQKCQMNIPLWSLLTDRNGCVDQGPQVSLCSTKSTSALQKDTNTQREEEMGLTDTVPLQIKCEARSDR